MTPNHQPATTLRLDVDGGADPRSVRVADPTTATLGELAESLGLGIGSDDVVVDSRHLPAATTLADAGI